MSEHPSKDKHRELYQLQSLLLSLPKKERKEFKQKIALLEEEIAAAAEDHLMMIQ